MIRWSVPPATWEVGSVVELWLGGTVTSPSFTNLNLQIGLGARNLLVSYEDEDGRPELNGYLEKGAMSTGGKPEEVPEARMLVEPRAGITAADEDAFVEINLGWQSTGCKVAYRYMYRR